MTVVAYGIAQRNPQSENWEEEDAAKRWTTREGRPDPIWLREGQDTAREPVEKRHRLHLCLFMIRSGLADTIWIREQGVLGDPALAIVHAITQSAGAQLVISEEPYEPAPDDAELSRVIRWLSLLDLASPRETEVVNGVPADLGVSPEVYPGARDVARLTLKLHNDMSMTYRQVGAVLQDGDMPKDPRQGTFYSHGVLSGLTKDHAGESISPAELGMDEVHLQDLVLRGPSLAGQFSRRLAAVVGVNPERLVTEVHEAEGMTDVTWISVENDAEDPARGSIAWQLLVMTPLLTGALLDEWPPTDEGSLDDAELALARLEYYGVIRCGTSPGSQRSDAPGSGVTTTARSLVRLHAILRAHDQGLVTDTRLTHLEARKLAESIRNRNYQRTLQHIANQLNRQGIPTRGPGGQWWPSSVKDLLETPSQP